jgi:tetratricopeptide (TPR) repeat protein
MEHARYAARLLEATGPSRAKALVLVNLASTLLESGHPHEAIKAGREAVAIAGELGLAELRGRALNYLGCARFEGGDFAGVVDLEQAVAITSRSIRLIARLPMATWPTCCSPLAS